jgi:glycosyltransferase involved in cell wall biosynthesis
VPAPADLLVLAAGLGTGGTERHLQRLLPGLVRRGLRPAVWNAGEDGAAAAALQAAGIAVRTWRAATSPRHLARLAAAVSDLSRSRPRLVHSYLYGRHWLDAVACRLAGVPYLTSRRNLAHWRSGPVLARERWRDRRAAAVVANSAAAARVALADGAPAERITVIPNGVPLPAWSAAAWSGDETWRSRRDAARQRLGLDAAARVVGSVAGLKQIKDPDLLLDSFLARPGRRPGDRLVLVGEGPLAPALAARAAAEGAADALLLPGRRDDAGDLLAAFDLFCLPSRAEGSSNALLEAMAAALPVVATRVGGSAEAVVDGATGLLVPAGDGAALAAALERLLDAPETAAAMGRAGRERAAACYGLEAMVAAHFDLYRRLLGADMRHVA